MPPRMSEIRWEVKEWDAEIESLRSAWNKDANENEKKTAKPEELNSKQCAVLDHVAWRVAKTAWRNSERLKEEEAEAIRLIKDEPKKARKKIKQAIQTARRWKKETEKPNAIEISEAPEHVRRVLCTQQTRSISGFRKAGSSTGMEDTFLADDIKGGFTSFRTPTLANSYPKRDEPKMGDRAHLPTSTFETTIKELRRMTKPNFDDELLDFVWNEIQDDVKLGRYEAIEENQLKYKPALAFPVCQDNKIRTCMRTVLSP